MKFKEEIKYTESTFKHLLEGISIDNIKYNLKQEGLYDLDINKVLRSAKGRLLDKYEARVIEMVLNKSTQSISEELVELHSSTIEYLIDSAKDRLKQKERVRVKQLLYDNHDLETILSSVKLDLYSKKEVENQFSRHNKKYQEADEKRNWNVYGGLLLLAFFAYTLLDESWGRPLYGSGIAAIVLIYRGININTGKKNIIK